MKLYLLFLACLCTFIANAQKLFTEMPSSFTNVSFVNLIKENNQLNILSYEYLYNGGGVAIGDINNDGLQDIYFTGNMVPNKLYLNKGNLQFEDITLKSGTEAPLGYKTGTCMADVNNDGYIDIYVCRSMSTHPDFRKNLLFINNKNNTFTESAEQYGIADASYSIQAYFFDMDLDKDLDLVLLNHPSEIGSANDIHVGYNAAGVLAAKEDTQRTNVSYRYYVNENGKFKDKTIKAGLGTYAFGLSAIIADFSGDGYPDIYSCNDYREPDYLFVNNKNGTFTEKAKTYFKHFSTSSMGSDYADINNDGLLDLYTVDMLPPELEKIKSLKGPDPYDIFFKKVQYGYGHQYVKNVLQLNNGNNTYSDISYLSGVAFTDWSWAPLIADFDNDGNKDIFVAKGYFRDLTDLDYASYKADSIRKLVFASKAEIEVQQLLGLIPTRKTPNFFFKNNGNLTFSNMGNEIGLEKPFWSNGASYADLDNDGDLDLIINNLFDQSSIYKNTTVDTKKGNFVRFGFGTENNLALGATITLETIDGKMQVQQYMPTKGFMSNHEQAVHFGIGANTSARASIKWLNGKISQINNVIVNSTNLVSPTKSVTNENMQNEMPKKLFKDITTTTKINYIPTEKDYIDFKLEPLLPHQFSKLGPCVAVADVNGDKLEDFFIGGSAGTEAKIFLQSAQGTFATQKSAAFSADSKYEDTGVQFFDADGDKDLDLVVVSGGNEIVNDDKMYPVRLYINNGKGEFKKSEAIQNVNTSAKGLAIADFDKDGDSDIFIGGYVTPGKYGLLQNSILLQNNAGVYKNIAMEIPELEKIGMITSAVWSDMDGDTYLDLCLVGEWMPLTVYFNNKGSLKMKPVQYPNTNGWWNTIATADVDGDADMDLVCGNLGVNSRYKCDATHPMTMHVSDYDNNGSTDCVISVFQDTEARKGMPIALRDNLLDQMVFLKKKYLRYTNYATASVDDIFSKEQLAKAKIFSTNNMQSTIFYNDGKANLTIKPLGAKAQFSTVNAIVLEDYDGDNKTDILLAGNNYETDVETGRNDASIGVFMKNVQPGKFKTIDYLQSGFNAFGNVRTMNSIIINGKRAIIIGKNNEPLQIISVN